jgi:hypothetical protein
MCDWLSECNLGMKLRGILPDKMTQISDIECINHFHNHVANGTAMSLCAKVPPYRPDRASISTAQVRSSHLDTDIKNVFLVNSDLIWWNSTKLKSGLLTFSQTPKNSIVEPLRNQVSDMPARVAFDISRHVGQTNKITFFVGKKVDFAALHHYFFVGRIFLFVKFWIKAPLF